MTARCACGAAATNQALYERADGSHFLGDPVCDEHRYRLGPPEYAQHTTVITHMAVAR